MYQHNNNLESLKLYKSALNIVSLAKKIDGKHLKPSDIYAEIKTMRLKSEVNKCQNSQTTTSTPLSE